ncbi:hypothetical protein LCGC14_2518870 [marine sediment metagenome]|uniref:Nudix hydrolase domain-containing protein n=1 Tax=marine sediment metagenome TaxID=412755 RepID=A0A0F9BJY0_9ZZZZ
METKSKDVEAIEAVIGVWHKDGKTFYVKRSHQMENYPDVWSLLSIQFTPEEMPDFTDFTPVPSILERMSQQRLGGVPIHFKRYLKSARCSDNPMNVPVTLHLYEVELEREPELNPDYYVDSGWFSVDEYLKASENATCGLCMRMWSDYCVQAGLSDVRFAPSVR